MNKLNVLVAYPYCKPGLLEVLQRFPADQLRLILDSGAFTAWNSGAPIQLDDYCKFLESLPLKPWRYFALDVIGDPDNTMKNFNKMVERGFCPVPIYTPGEDTSAIEHFYKFSDVVAFGGINGFRGHKLKGYVNGVMKIANGRKVHLLGFTNFRFLKAYRPYMCDSSTWEMGARFARLTMYMGQGKVIILHKSDFKNKPSKELLNRIKFYGLDPYELAKNANWGGGLSINRTLCARTNVALSVDIERNLGTKMFLALTTNMAFNLLAQSFDILYSQRLKA